MAIPATGPDTMLKWYMKKRCREIHPSARSTSTGAIGHAIGEGGRWSWRETLWLVFPVGWTFSFSFGLQPDGCVLKVSGCWSW
jgi:hypothetical protein